MEDEKAPSRPGMGRLQGGDEETEAGCGRGQCYQGQDDLCLRGSSEVKCRGRQSSLKSPGMTGREVGLQGAGVSMEGKKMDSAAETSVPKCSQWKKRWVG